MHVIDHDTGELHTQPFRGSLRVTVKRRNLEDGYVAVDAANSNFEPEDEEKTSLIPGLFWALGAR